MIDKKSIEHIAQLARLKLEKKEWKALEKDLMAILQYVDKLKEVDISQVELKKEAEEKTLREDKVETALSQSKDLLSLAPAREKNYISVKSVFKQYGN